MRRTVVWFALIAGSLRLLFGLGAMLNAYFSPEAHMMALLDLPTLGVYFFLGESGLNMSVRNAYDPRFLVIGVTVWMIIGAMAGLVWYWHTTRRAEGASGASGGRGGTA